MQIGEVLTCEVSLLVDSMPNTECFMAGSFTAVGCEALKRRKEGKIKRRDSEVDEIR